MATSGEETLLIETCTAESTSTSDPANRAGEHCQKRCTIRPHRRWSVRSIGSRRLLMLLAWGFIIHCSISLTVYQIQYSHSHLDKEEQENPSSPWVMQWRNILYIAILSISIPIASLLAEVAVGRYKLVSYSLRAFWLLSIGGSVLTILQFSQHITSETVNNITFLLVVIPQYALLGAFLACAIPLGLDQIPDGSNTNVSAFIMWFAWTFPSGYGVPQLLVPVFYRCSSLKVSEVNLVVSLVSVLLLSLGLIFDYFFKHTLVQEPVSFNPLSLIFRVLRYAAKHKVAVQRSAFTYCENEQPTRLDYGKSKYGGPFSTEQVEDVKTFWRVLAVLLVIAAFYLPLQPLYESTTDLERNFPSLDSQSECLQTASLGIYEPFPLTMYSVPVYELLIHPFLDCRPSILQSAGINAAAVTIVSVYGMMLEMARQVLTYNTSECMFIKDPTANKHGVNRFLIGIPFNFIVGFSTFGLYKSSIEFLCAQAPNNMRGVLTGISYMLQTLFRALGTLLYITWKGKYFEKLNTSSCGIWFYLTTLLITLMLSVLFSYVVRQYKGRERDEIGGSQIQVEDVYYKYYKDKMNKHHQRNRPLSIPTPYQL